MPVQKTKPSDYPQAVITQIELLAQNIVIARKRRKETQAQWAKKLGVSQPTMARIEKGDPAVAMASYVMCMWLINPASALADLVAPQSDHISLEREVTKARARRTPRAPVALLPQESRIPVKLGTDLKLAHGLGSSSAAELTRSMGGSSAQTAAGLAALIAKAQGNAK